MGRHRAAGGLDRIRHPGAAHLPRARRRSQLRRLPDRTAIALTIGALAAYDVLRSTVIPHAAHFAANVAMIGVVALPALAARMSHRELGLTRDRLGSGVRVGLIAAAVVGAAVAVAAAVVGIDSSFIRERADMSGPSMLFQAFVEIPLATVLFEELAFRGVLGGLFHRVATARNAVILSSVVFGLWHLPPLWGTSVGGLVGTFAATFAAGVVLQLVKDRTGSLAAPAITHWATNGLALALVWTIGAVR